MFEGITTVQWVSFMAVGGLGACLIGLVRRRRTALIALALWLIAPGLLFTVLSIVPDVQTFFGMLFLLTAFTAIPWGIAVVPTFLLVRLTRRWLRSKKIADSDPPHEPATHFDIELPPEEWREHLCDDLVRILDEIRPLQPLQVVALGVVDVRTQNLLAVLDQSLSTAALERVQQLCTADARLNPTRCAVACQEHWNAVRWPFTAGSSSD